MHGVGLLIAKQILACPGIQEIVHLFGKGPDIGVGAKRVGSEGSLIDFGGGADFPLQGPALDDRIVGGGVYTVGRHFDISRKNVREIVQANT